MGGRNLSLKIYFVDDPLEREQRVGPQLLRLDLLGVCQVPVVPELLSDPVVEELLVGVDEALAVAEEGAVQRQ